MSSFAEITLAWTPTEDIARKLLDVALVPAGARAHIHLGRQGVDMRGIAELRRQQDRGVRITFSGHPTAVNAWRNALSAGYAAACA